MTSRKTLDQMTSNDLDRLYQDLKIVTDRACRDSEDLVRTETERDGAYRERAHLVALLTTHYPTVIAPALDCDEPGWWIAYLTIGGRQCSWHISPRDAGLFAHVERVEPDDPRALWDGHTTDAKYEWLRKLAALRAPAPITDIEDRTVCTCTFDTRCGCGTSVHYQPAPGPAAAEDKPAAPAKARFRSEYQMEREIAGRIAIINAACGEEKTVPACTATIEGPHIPGGPVHCTREAGHPENHASPAPGTDGKVMWNDHHAGATPHQAGSEEQH